MNRHYKETNQKFLWNFVVVCFQARKEMKALRNKVHQEYARLFLETGRTLKHGVGQTVKT